MTRIAHICLCGQYLDGWGYQENVLSRYLVKAGVDNHVIASACDFPSYLPESAVSAIKAKGTEYDCEGSHIHRIRTFSFTSSVEFSRELTTVLERIKPDIIFHHDVVFSTLPVVARYAHRSGAMLMVDNHADELNITRNRAWRWLYHKVLNRAACSRIADDVAVYYGVTPGRCSFLEKYYSIPSDKISFLPIGADVDATADVAPREQLRVQYGISADAFVVVSGGKMSVAKGIADLVEAVGSLREEGLDVELLLFGKFEDDASREAASGKDYVHVHGWCDRRKTLELLKLSDLACWSVQHTTLIEDAVSVETPLLLKETPSTSHLVEANGRFVSGGSDALTCDIRHFVKMTPEEQARLREGCARMKAKIGYDAIAKRILDDFEALR